MNIRVAVHGILGALVTMHPALGKLPGVLAIDPAPPQYLILLIADDDPDVGSKPFAVDDALVVSLWIQDGKPSVAI